MRSDWQNFGQKGALLTNPCRRQQMRGPGPGQIMSDARPGARGPGPGAPGPRGPCPGPPGQILRTNFALGPQSRIVFEEGVPTEPAQSSQQRDYSAVHDVSPRHSRASGGSARRSAHLPGAAATMSIKYTQAVNASANSPGTTPKTGRLYAIKISTSMKRFGAPATARRSNRRSRTQDHRKAQTSEGDVDEEDEPIVDVVTEHPARRTRGK